MLKIFTGLAFAAFTLTTAALADDTKRRELGAHAHGQGTLDIAVEGNTIQMELVAPGVDIVGFEHEAATMEQTALVEKAKAKLTDVLALFKLPAAANCEANAANVETRDDEHQSGAKDDHDHDHESEAAKPSHGHAEFHATWTISCKAPESLTGLETAYFENFSGAQLLNVNVTTSKGQTQAQMTRDKPRLDLAGVM
ncbi:DUF2796 domain-containing protein [Hyphomicrobium sp.]|uniref:DUF2796 domain-containing protein n=1 Tax=Hyphomicrobium sp. TaxID=82 RepID=UPI002D78BDB6|nr:DUF2796 domain-containing protein [Hyphomicrobium sp.]HET6389202.1 DUF2796 domain-containing protein [Hyphomicrobium sp.]